MDFDPKPGAGILCHSLPNLGEMVHREIQAANQANSAENLLYRAMDTYWDGSVLINTLEGPWNIRYANEAFSNMTGVSSNSLRLQQFPVQVSAPTEKPPLGRMRLRFHLAHSHV